MSLPLPAYLHCVASKLVGTGGKGMTRGALPEDLGCSLASEGVSIPEMQPCASLRQTLKMISKIL